MNRALAAVAALGVGAAVTLSGASAAISPGASWDAAYDAAACGDVIELASGSWPSQTLTGSKACTQHVTFRPAAGATVTVNGDLENRANWVKIEGVKVTGDMNLAEGGANAHHVIFNNVDSANFVIGPGHDITLSNSDIGPSNGCGFNVENKIGPDPGVSATATPYNLEIVNNLIHDQNGDPSGGCHFGGLFVIAGHHIAFRGNDFVRNVVYDFYVSPFADDTFGGVSDLTLENNTFAGPVEWRPDDTTWDGQPNLQFTCHGNPTPTNCNYRNWLIRYNSLTAGWHFFSSGSNSNVRFVGNIAPVPSSSNCSRGLYDRNVFRGGTCSATDRSVSSLPFVSGNLASPNLHLTGGIAVDLLPGTTTDQQLATDMDGQARPMGAGYDAGADELGSSPPPSPQCSNGINDDPAEDSLIDFPADPGCTSTSDASESPNPPPSPQCSDGIDNADPEDTLIDFPADPGCVSAADNDETNAPPPGDTTAPSAPGNFRVCSGTRTTATLCWDASLDNVGVTGYRVFNGTGTLLTTTTTLEFTRTNLKCAQQYTSRVQAFDAAGNVSALSSYVTVCAFR